MVQWFKSLFRVKVYRKPRCNQILSFNKEQLSKSIQNLSDKLYDFRQEASWQIIREVIELAKNIQILEVGLCCHENELVFHKGRLQALSDLTNYIDTAVEAKRLEHKQEKKPPKTRPRGAIKMTSEPVF